MIKSANTYDPYARSILKEALDLHQLFRSWEEVARLVSLKYQKFSPAVANWAEFFWNRRDREITLAEVGFLLRLHEEPVHQFAQNELYHLLHSLGKSTVGMIDY